MTEGRRYNPLWELSLARLREFLREPEALFWSFGFPILLAVALGIAFRSRPDETFHVAVTGAQADVMHAQALLISDPSFDVELSDEEGAATALRKGRVDVVLVPAEDGSFTLRYDPDRPESRMARVVTTDALQKGMGRSDVATVHDAPQNQKGSRYIDFLIPGLIGLNVLSSSMWGTAYAIVYARKRRLLRRLAATPMKRSHYLLSNILSRMVFLVFEVSALLLFGRLIFGIQIQGSIFAVSVVCLLGGVAFMGIALLIAARPSSTEVAGGWMNAVMLPMYLLSGSFFSYERFPAAIHPYLRALPLTAFNDALRAIVNEGASLVTVAPQIGILVLWGGLGFVLALKLFRWV
jgi:ABC-2 type transport system permease protein